MENKKYKNNIFLIFWILAFDLNFFWLFKYDVQGEWYDVRNFIAILLEIIVTAFLIHRKPKFLIENIIRFEPLLLFYLLTLKSSLAVLIFTIIILIANQYIAIFLLNNPKSTRFFEKTEERKIKILIIVTSALFVLIVCSALFIGIDEFYAM